MKRQEIEEELENLKQNIEEILSNLSSIEHDEEVPPCIKKTTLELLGEIINKVSPLSNNLYKDLYKDR
jgi:predicted nucleotide-binding protein (sugar kinase/HSP70/actin superfamily)